MASTVASWFSWSRSIPFGERRIKLLRVLAEGGYAVVFEGQDTNTGEVYAVKRIIAPDAETQAHAEHEIAVHRRLRHEHIGAPAGKHHVECVHGRRRIG